MGVDSLIHAQNAPNASFGSRPYSLGNEDDPVMGKIDVRIASLACAKFNLSSVLSRMVEHKIGCLLYCYWSKRYVLSCRNKYGLT